MILPPARVRTVAFGILVLLASVGSRAATWPDALAAMPLKTEAHQLDWTNCAQIVLDSLQSNPVVKGVVFMPGATDELYMFRRLRAILSRPNPTLWDAVAALTNQARIQATFRAPLLLLHTPEDSLEPDTLVRDERTAAKLKRASAPVHLFCNDRDWDYLQPILRHALRIDIRPWPHSLDSWHFYRHSFAAWNLTAWEALEATALAGKTKVTVRRNAVLFEVDRRLPITPSNSVKP